MFIVLLFIKVKLRITKKPPLLSIWRISLESFPHPSVAISIYFRHCPRVSSTSKQVQETVPVAKGPQSEKFAPQHIHRKSNWFLLIFDFGFSCNFFMFAKIHALSRYWFWINLIASEYGKCCNRHICHRSTFI